MPTVDNDLIETSRTAARVGWRVVRRVVLGIIVVPIVVLILCGARTYMFPPNARQLSGVYSLHDLHSGGNVRGDLTIYADGTFSQHLLTPNQGRLTSRGRWRICDRSFVRFDDFLYLEGSKFVPKSGVELSPEWTLNRVEISWEQGRFHYRRTGNGPSQ